MRNGSSLRRADSAPTIRLIDCAVADATALVSIFFGANGRSALAFLAARCPLSTASNRLGNVASPALLNPAGGRAPAARACNPPISVFAALCASTCQNL